MACGSFIFTDFEARKFYEITNNPLFHYAPASPSKTTITDTNTTSSTTTNQTTIQGFYETLILGVSISTASTVIILYCAITIIRRRRVQ